jgi:hypothetical protein
MPCIPNPFKIKWKHYYPPLVNYSTRSEFRIPNSRRGRFSPRRRIVPLRAGGQPAEPVRLKGRRVGTDPYGFRLDSVPKRNPGRDYALEGRAYSSERSEAEIRILFYASAGSSSPSMTSDDSRVSGGAAPSTAVSIGFNSRSWGNIGR